MEAAHAAFELLHPLEELGRRRTPGEQLPKVSIVQHVSQLGKNAKMRRHRRTDHREQRMDWLGIDGVEIDRVLQQAQGNEGYRHVEHDRIAHMRDRDPVPDPGRPHRLPSLQDRYQKLSVYVGGQGKPGNDLSQYIMFVISRHVVIHAAARQQAGKRRGFVPVHASLLQKLARDGDAVLDRPLPYLDRVEMETLVRPVNREAPGTNPFPESALVHAEVTGDIAQRELQEGGPWAQTTIGIQK